MNNKWFAKNSVGNKSHDKFLFPKLSSKKYYNLLQLICTKYYLKYRYFRSLVFIYDVFSFILWLKVKKAGRLLYFLVLNQQVC